jgi:hypothetical protein
MLKTAFALLLLTTAPAMAFDRAFIGSWAPDSQSCDPDGNSRFNVTPKGMGGREFSCDLKRATPNGPSWRLQYSCVGEGDTYALDLKWRLDANGHLIEQSEGKTTDYTRCGGAKAAAAPAAPAAAGDDFTGKYAGRKDTYKWTASISPKGQTYKVKVNVDASMPECSGQYDGVGQLQGGKIVTQPTSDDACAVTISRSGNGIYVEETQRPDCQDHGQACGFTSHMKRVGQ